MGSGAGEAINMEVTVSSGLLFKKVPPLPGDGKLVHLGALWAKGRRRVRADHILKGGSFLLPRS